jgi:hypothetical protein
MDGSVVKIAKINETEQQIDGLKQGIYILNIYGQGECLQTKLIVP